MDLTSLAFINEGVLMNGQQNPEAVALARELRQTKLSYEKIAEELEARGYVNRFGRPFSFDSVRYMIGGTRYRKHPTEAREPRSAILGRWPGTPGQGA